MTQFLPSGLLALFAPRDPIPFKPPLQTLTWEKDREKAPYTGVGHLVSLFEDSTETPPPTRGETKAEKKRRKIKEREERRVVEIQDEVNTWDPHNDPNAGGDAFKTLFVSRISYDTTESKLKREFEKYGRIKKVTMVKNIVTGKPRGYAFIEYEKERDMHNAYKSADGNKIEGRRVLVDVERGRTVKGWKPRRLGGGLGSTRAHTDIMNRDSERDREEKSSDRRGDSGRSSSRRKSSERTSHRERDRSDRERGTRDRGDREKSDRDRGDRDRSTRDRSDRDKSDREKSDRDRSDRDKSNRDKSDRDKNDRDKNDREKSDRDRGDRDKRKRDDRRDRDKKDDKDRSERRHRESRRDRDKDREHRRDRDKDRSNRDRRDKSKGDNPRSGENADAPSEHNVPSKPEQFESESFPGDPQAAMEDKMQVNNDGPGDGNPNNMDGHFIKNENNGYNDQMPTNNENGVNNDYNPMGLKREFDNEENMQSENY